MTDYAPHLELRSYLLSVHSLTLPFTGFCSGPSVLRECVDRSLLKLACLCYYSNEDYRVFTERFPIQPLNEVGGGGDLLLDFRKQYKCLKYILTHLKSQGFWAPGGMEKSRTPASCILGSVGIQLASWLLRPTSSWRTEFRVAQVCKAEGRQGAPDAQTQTEIHQTGESQNGDSSRKSRLTGHSLSLRLILLSKLSSGRLELGFIYRQREALVRLCNEPRCFYSGCEMNCCRRGPTQEFLLVTLEEKLHTSNRGLQSLLKAHKCDQRLNVCRIGKRMKYGHKVFYQNVNNTFIVRLAREMSKADHSKKRGIEQSTSARKCASLESRVQVSDKSPRN